MSLSSTFASPEQPSFSFSEADFKRLDRRRTFLMINLTNQNCNLIITLPANNTPWNLSNTRYMGDGNIYNTALSVNQFLQALALIDHPLIDDLCLRSNLQRVITENTQNSPLQNLIDAKVAKGFRVLDLGCGVCPMFARVMRAIGAEVYTVDIISADDFELSPDQQENEFTCLEKANHIQVNFHDADAAHLILDRSGGHRFHYVTDAHPMIMDGRSFYNGPEESFLQKVLAPGAIYYNANRFSGDESKYFKIGKSNSPRNNPEGLDAKP